jgi:hypothetical protein
MHGIADRLIVLIYPAGDFRMNKDSIEFACHRSGVSGRPSSRRTMWVSCAM